VRKHPAFQGDFSWQVLAEDSMKLSWVNGADSLSLSFSLKNPSFAIEGTQIKSVSGISELANY
jgi:hypothetical protein